VKDLPKSCKSGLSACRSVAADLRSGGSLGLGVRKSIFDGVMAIGEGHPKLCRHVLKALYPRRGEKKRERKKYISIP
jgi:hypothetical protein